MLRALYVDLDGTLLGPGGALLAGADGGFSLEGVRALEACARAGVEVVIYSGRRQSSVAEDARLMGQRSYIFELGCALVLDGELEWLTDGLEPSAEAGSIYDQITASGAPRALIEAFPGRLEDHVPWSAGREVSHLFRGEVDPDRAAAVLAAGGWDWLRLVPNGVMSTRGGSGGFAAGGGSGGSVAGGGSAGSAGGAGPDVFVGYGLSDQVQRVHAYHLIPARSSKARAVARHMQNRGYAAHECIACGDSREDMDAAGVVGTFWMMRNGVERDPTLAAEVAARPGVRVTTERLGAGVYEAVVTTLAGG